MTAGSEEKERSKERKQGLWYCHLVVKNTLWSLHSYLSVAKKRKRRAYFTTEEGKKEFDLIQEFFQEIVAYKQFINEGTWKVDRPDGIEEEYSSIDGIC